MYFVTALQQCNGDWEATLAMLRSTEPFPFAFLTPLLNELAQLQTDLILFWMIIISLQLQLSIMQLLSGAFTHSGVHRHRVDPPLPLANCEFALN